MQINNKMHKVIAHIDLSSLRYNLDWLKTRLFPKTKILGMVKCNAYGHGAPEVATEIANLVAAFGVANIDEGLELRAAGIFTPIVVLQGFADAAELLLMDKYKLETVIHNQEQLTILEKLSLKNLLSVWCKIDTGLHRLGFSPQEAVNAMCTLLQNPNVQKPLQIMTHFSSADDLFGSETAEQFGCFQATMKNLDLLSTRAPACQFSLANSAAILNWPELCVDVVRPGILLYGASPLSDKTGTDLGLKPVMTLKSQLIAIHDLQKGDRVSYGGSFTCPEPMRVGIVAIGYGSGYPRGAKNGTPILINGEICPLIGRVAMDMLCVDLRPCSAACIGATAILWGEGLPIEQVAQHNDTIAHELFAHLTARVHYSFITPS